MHEGCCLEAGFQPIVTCEVDEPAAIGGLVGSGLGIAFFPAPAKTFMSDKIVFLTIEEPICQRTLQLSWNEQKYFSKAAIAFKAFVVDYFSNCD